MDLFIENHNMVIEDRDYRYLVLSGSGIKGLVCCGILDALENAGILYDDRGKFKLKGIAGTSFSSFFVALLGVGYTPAEIQGIVMRLDTGKLRDRKLSKLGLIIKKGAHKGSTIYKLLGQLIQRKYGNPDFSLYHLYKRKGIRLVMMSTNIIDKKAISLDALNEYGHLPIRKAVQMSMAIPFLFEPIPYHHQLFVDGSLLNNYPINVFDDEGPNPYVLGIRVIFSDDTKLETNSLLKYGISLIQLYQETNPIMLAKADMMRTITVITKNYPLTQLRLSRSEKLDLITTGIESIETYFS
jgi:NTE family protein